MQEKDKPLFLEKLIGPLSSFKALHIIIFVGIIVFFNALFGGFVWDDSSIILYNPTIKHIDLLGIFGQNILNNGFYYRPIFLLYIASIYKIFGTTLFFYHFIQIAIHIINSGLFFSILKRFISKNVSLFISLIFLIHPMQVESVAWISASLVPLSLMFSMLALIIAFKEKLGTRELIILFFMLLLSILTRETVFLFFPLLLLFKLIIQKKDFIKFLCIEIFVVIVYFFIRVGAGNIYSQGHYYSPFLGISFYQKLLNIPTIFFFYIKTFFLPFIVAADQIWTVKDITLNNFYIPLLLDFTFILILLLLTLYIKRFRFKYFNIFIFFLIWFLIGSISFLPIIPISSTVADRYLYFPLIGLLGMVGIIIDLIKFRKIVIKELAIFLAIAVLTILSIRTMIRNDNWHSYFSLLSHDVNTIENFDLDNNYGTLFVIEKKDDKLALKYFLRSVYLEPNEVNLKNVGSVYFRQGRSNKALEYFNKALIVNQSSKKVLREEIYVSIVTVYLRDKNYRDASRVSKDVLREYSNNISLWMMLAISDHFMNNRKDALNEANKAYQLSPNQSTTYLYNQILNNKPISLEWNH